MLRAPDFFLRIPAFIVGSPQKEKTWRTGSRRGTARPRRSSVNRATPVFLPDGRRASVARQMSETRHVRPESREGRLADACRIRFSRLPKKPPPPNDGNPISCGVPYFRRTVSGARPPRFRGCATLRHRAEGRKTGPHRNITRTRRDACCVADGRPPSLHSWHLSRKQSTSTRGHVCKVNANSAGPVRNPSVLLLQGLLSSLKCLLARNTTIFFDLFSAVLVTRVLVLGLPPGVINENVASRREAPPTLLKTGYFFSRLYILSTVIILIYIFASCRGHRLFTSLTNSENRKST